MVFTRLLPVFCVSVMVTYSLASLAHTQQVLSGLLDLGVTIPVADRITMIVHDWLGLYLYLAVITIGLLIAFIVMAVLKRYWPLSAVLLFAIGGTLAMFVILESMRELSSLTPIAGARTTFGLILQCLAGAAGGTVFGIAVNKLGSAS